MIDKNGGTSSARYNAKDWYSQYWAAANDRNSYRSQRDEWTEKYNEKDKVLSDVVGVLAEFNVSTASKSKLREDLKSLRDYGHT